MTLYHFKSDLLICALFDAYVSIQKSFLINVFERDDIDYTSLKTFADFKKMIERLLEL